MRTPTAALPTDYALVLQQVSEAGTEDMSTLADMLQYSRSRLVHIVQGLRHKGLVHFSQDTYHEPLISLSAKGRRLMRSLWPEAMVQSSY